MAGQPTKASSIMDDVDVESLRQIFGGTAANEVHRQRPHELRKLLEDAGSGVPRFLLDAEDEEHIAPHTFALELLLSGANLEKTLRAPRSIWPLIPIALLSLLCQIVLEIFGGAGAIWGCAELMRLRKGGSTHPSWDISSWLALAVGIFCAVRFTLINCVIFSHDPTFQERNLLFDAAHVSFLERARCVAKEPILFLQSCCCRCSSSQIKQDEIIEMPSMQ